MREIKFRAWHTDLKKMFSAETLGKDQVTIIPNGDGFINVSGASTALSELLTSMIPLQYTGLKDKNGVEIYEGDIFVINKNDDDWHDFVEYRRKQAKFELSSFRRAVTDISLIWASKDSECEVIGNIHQNKELLKD